MRRRSAGGDGLAVMEVLVRITSRQFLEQLNMTLDYRSWNLLNCFILPLRKDVLCGPCSGLDSASLTLTLDCLCLKHTLGIFSTHQLPHKCFCKAPCYFTQRARLLVDHGCLARLKRFFSPLPRV